MHGSGRDQISLIECLWRDGIDPYAIGTLGDNLQRCDLFLQMNHSNDLTVMEMNDIEDLK